MDAAVAKEISDLMLDVTRRLDDSLTSVHDRLADDEFDHYRRAVGTVLGAILLEVLNPLYAEHPNLKPPGMT
jgi:hypothetical protein